MVAGVNGQLGVPVVRHAGRAPVLGRGDVIHPLLLTGANTVLDLSLKKRFAIINLATLQVRTPQYSALS